MCFHIAGYIKALITELWSTIECGKTDITLFTPKSWPVDPIDKSSHKVRNVKNAIYWF